jgi:pentapeptide MXKDX repeat protein
MRKVLQVIVLAVGGLGLGLATVGCNSSTTNGNDKMHGDKMGSAKMGDDKMAEDKMGGEKMNSGTMSGDKMGGQKMNERPGG